ncbi:unnamed protein product [Trichogramma brassicae]|uniref:Uncharacterized protein n=1 Tax=Trichogramma brassicae TaxID=86971 RepID=A0A6H5I3F2_9HYME|nr:unnamed protein product [Trichogramma brassicae]
MRNSSSGANESAKRAAVPTAESDCAASSSPRGPRVFDIFSHAAAASDSSVNDTLRVECTPLRAMPPLDPDGHLLVYSSTIDYPSTDEKKQAAAVICHRSALAHKLIQRAHAIRAFEG